jgi:glycyl-tRNA synthetase beta chain
LGVIRTIRETGLRLRLLSLIAAAGQGFANRGIAAAPASEILDFLIERLRVQLRAEGRRHDVIAAALGAAPDDDLVRLEARANAVSALLGTDVGANLLIAYRRAANILRIEERKDGPHDAAPDTALLVAPEERDLVLALDRVLPEIDGLLGREAFHEVLAPMAGLRAPLDAFFDRVTVNDPDPDLRRNRLRLLNRVRATMNRVAEFSKIEA